MPKQAVLGQIVAEFIQTSIGNGVAVISLRHLPDAAFCLPQRIEFLAALQHAEQADDAIAIVLTGEAGALGADYPLGERLSGDQAPSFAQLCSAVHASRKPVVAALRGHIFEAGLELALSAHARVAHQSTRLRLSRLQSGRLPCPEALYSLASALGTKQSLKFLQSPSMLPVTNPILSPLFAEIVGQNAVGRAAEFARSCTKPLASPRPGAQDPLAYQDALETARADQVSPEQAALIDALEAAQLLPEFAFSALVKDSNTALAGTARSQALNYECGCHEALVPVMARPKMQRLTLVGTTSLARNLTLSALHAGVSVEVLELEDGGFTAHRKAITEATAQMVDRGALTQPQGDAILARLTQLETFEGLAEAEYVIECGAKSIDEIADLTARLRAALPASAPLLITAGMRQGAGRFSHLFAGNTAGAHFHFRSAGSAFAEVALGPDYGANNSVSKAAQLGYQRPLEQLGLPVIVQKAQDGLCSARLLTAYLQGAEECLARGATVAELNHALAGRVHPLRFQNAEGFRMQPFRISSFFMKDDTQEPPAGLGGYLRRAGFEGRNQTQAFTPDSDELLPDAAAALEVWADDLQDQGHVDETALSARDIQQITDAALYCVGAQLLEAGDIASSWELDFLTCAVLEAQPGYGGPFYQAQNHNLLEMRSFLRRYEPLRPAFFTPPADLDKMIKTGARYALPSKN